ncbi:MAG: 50S ribosomal protein L21 [Gemmatimonadota bacterium]|nr:50S ribosomal protein L21 [Gemmatimonadota bacterium]
MYAIFRAKGKQFRAVPDARLRLPTMDVEPGQTVTFDDVLLAEKDGDVHVGAPSVDGAAVEAEVVRHGRGEKIVVYKMKRRKGYRRKQGHRQGFTEIRITDIAFPKGKPKRPVVEEPEEPAAEEPEAGEPAAEAAPVEVEAPEEAEATAAEASEEEAGEAPEPEAAEIDITGAARELAEEHGLDLTGIEGTGKDGRILKSDVEKAIKAQED